MLPCQVLLKIHTPSCSSISKEKMEASGIAVIVFTVVAIIAVFCWAIYRMLYYNIDGSPKIRPGFGSDDTIDLAGRYSQPATRYSPPTPATGYSSPTTGYSSPTTGYSSPTTGYSSYATVTRVDDDEQCYFCQLCLASVPSSKWKSGEHRRLCSGQNAERLKVLKTIELSCKQCRQPLRLWPKIGLEFYCNGGNTCDSRGKGIVNTGINRFNCFLCDIDYCLPCVEEKLGRRVDLGYPAN